jgi:hypothetical protein
MNDRVVEQLASEARALLANENKMAVDAGVYRVLPDTVFGDAGVAEHVNRSR